VFGAKKNTKYSVLRTVKLELKTLKNIAITIDKQTASEDINNAASSDKYNKHDSFGFYASLVF